MRKPLHFEKVMEQYRLVVAKRNLSSNPKMLAVIDAVIDIIGGSDPSRYAIPDFYIASVNAWLSGDVRVPPSSIISHDTGSERLLPYSRS